MLDLLLNVPVDSDGHVGTSPQFYAYKCIQRLIGNQVVGRSVIIMKYIFLDGKQKTVH